MATQKKTLKELLAENLASVREEANTQIKYKVAIELGISAATINRYLAGIIFSVTLGTSIYTALQREIKQAKKELVDANKIAS